MQDDLYFYVLLLGVVFAGAALLGPGRKKQDAGADRHQVMNERQCRDLLQMMSEFKRDTERQLQILSKEHRDLKAEFSEMKSKAEKNGLASTMDEKDALQLNHRYAEVFELRRSGKTPGEIAKQLDMGIGEVELILQLHAKSSLPEQKR